MTLVEWYIDATHIMIWEIMLALTFVLQIINFLELRRRIHEERAHE